MVTATSPIVGCITVSWITILKHTQHYTLDSLLLLGVGSNVLQYGARISVQSRSLSPSFADSVHDIDDD